MANVTDNLSLRGVDHMKKQAALNQPTGFQKSKAGIMLGDSDTINEGMGYLSAAADVGNAMYNNIKSAKVDTSAVYNNIKDFNTNTQYNKAGDFDSLMDQYSSNSALSFTKDKSFGGKKGFWGMVGNNLKNFGKGFMSGMKTGNVYAGIAAGALQAGSATVGDLRRNYNIGKAVGKTNDAIAAANRAETLRFNNSLGNIQNKQSSNTLANYAAYGGLFNTGSGANSFAFNSATVNNATLNALGRNKITSLPNSFNSEEMKPMHSMQSFAFGGSLQTGGATYDAGFTKIANGGTHEENPNQGVQIGVDNKGVPNKVEEGEIVVGDYVFSNRLHVPKEFLEKYKIGGSSKTFAEVANILLKEQEERPNDEILKKTTKIIMNELAEQQEQTRTEEQEKNKQKFLDSLTPSEQEILDQIIEEQAQMQAEQMLQEMQGVPQGGDPSMMGGDPNQMDPAMQEQMMQQMMAQQGGMPQGGGMPPEAMMQGGGAPIPQEMAFGGSLYAYGGNMYGLGTNNIGNPRLYAYGGNLYENGGKKKLFPQGI